MADALRQLQDLSKALRRSSEVAESAHAAGVRQAGKLIVRRAPRRTGRLRDSIRVRQERPGRMVIEYPAAYRIVEEGGTIRPKRRQNLRIPFPGGRAGGSTHVRAKGGRLLLVRRTGRTTRVIAVLTSIARVRARHFISRPLAQEAPKIDRRILDTVAESLV